MAHARETVAARGLAWPHGAQPEGVDLVSGSALRARLRSGGLADATRLPQHPVRIYPRISAWPRGEFEVTAAPIGGLDPRDAPASFFHGLQEHGFIAWLDEATLGVALDDDAPAWQSRELLELIGLVARTRAAPPATLGVGLLGYGAIGAEHARAVSGTPGLSLVAVCDPKPDRVAAAQTFTPGLRAHATPEDLFSAPGVDLVIVSTPPDSHARWAMKALEAGCHVVVEKPMALTARECDDILDCARRQGLSASVYQNRRFDPDYEAIKSCVQAGRIGEPFHIEAFVGGYSHPCNYWHSDAAVSGGALFDWGSHVIDQVLDLMPGEVESVSAMNHKRMWHDVTNADHARMTMIFEGGREATFIYSDLAAALKPRWYVLGTEGALTGEWRRASVLSRNAIGTLDEDVFAPADAPPQVRLHSPGGDVALLSPPRREPYPFHADLVLSISYGFTPRVRGEQSRRVVSVLEAAEDSARLGGLPVKPA
jgi:scyllo-inositol 2-dehydrogenase (NADP+)